MRVILVLFPSLVAVVAARDGFNAGTTESRLVTIKTKTHLYMGKIDPQFPRTLQFRSIAFAQPPVGSRRWLPPQKLPRSRTPNLYDSTPLPPSCPQFISSVPTVLNTYFADGALIYNGHQSHTSGLVGAATSEDCLYLAVWTPATATPESKLPVLFFMSGGGFHSGGINLPYQLPMDWVERSQSHIVVTINYRLGIFGFPNASGLDEQNFGILDQRAALEWVRDNIAAFGGDPSAITQWGHSAGAMTADGHAYAFHEDPIARAYFLQSGTAFNGGPIVDPAFSNFSFVAKHFGCNHSPQSQFSRRQELDCMRAIPFKEITNFVGQYTDNRTVPKLDFLPVVDEHLVFANYTARAAEGRVARLPTIISNAANEGSTLVPFDSAGIPQNNISGVTLALFVCPAYFSTLSRNHLSIPVYRFQYAGTYPKVTTLPRLGAYHGSDVPMIFGTYGLVKGPDLGQVTLREIVTSRTMQSYVLAFVRDPVNGPRALGWEPVDTRPGVTEAARGKVVRFASRGMPVRYVDPLEIDGVCRCGGVYNAFP